MILNEENRELKLVVVALALTACHVLGIDAGVTLQMIGGGQTLVDPDVADLLAIIKEAHLPVAKVGGDWQSIVGMWIGVGIFSACRVWIKSQVGTFHCDGGEDEK